MTAGMHRHVGFVTGMLESELQASGLQNLWLLKDEPFLLSQKQLHFHILLLFTMFSCLLRLDLKSFKDPVFPELTCLSTTVEWNLIEILSESHWYLLWRSPWKIYHRETQDVLKGRTKITILISDGARRECPGLVLFFTALIPRVFQCFSWILVLVYFRSQF